MESEGWKYRFFVSCFAELFERKPKHLFWYSKIFFEYICCMKNKILGILVVIVVILLMLLGYFISKYTSMADEYERERDNSEILMQESKHQRDGFTKTLIVTEQQFADHYKEKLDSLNKLHKNEKIKMRRVISMLEISLQHERNNVKEYWRDSIQSGDTTYLGRILQFSDSCLSFDVYEPKGDSAKFAIVSGRLNLELDAIIYNGKRRKNSRLFGWRIFSGREQTVQVFSNCGEIQVKSVEIKK